LEDLQKILEADSPEGIEALAVKRITELNDEVAKVTKENVELNKKLENEDEGNKPENEDNEDQNNEDENEDEDESNSEVEESVEVKTLKEENARLVKENEELKKDSDEKTDALEKLNDSVEKLSKKTDAIGKKQVRPLYNDSDDEIEKLKNKRQNIYADSRGEK